MRVGLLYFYSTIELGYNKGKDKLGVKYTIEYMDKDKTDEEMRE